MKTRPGAPPDFFAVEADGLRWLAEPGALPVPEVLGVEPGRIVLEWVEPGRVTADAAERFGAGLAAVHRAGAPRFGAERNGYIGRLPLDNRPAGEGTGWPAFYWERRIEPYLRMATDLGRFSPADVAVFEAVGRRLPERGGPPEPPSRIHGDLWTGNVLWGADGRGWLIDPAAHGGHREADLAMLDLFGSPHPAVLAAYDAAWPLADGWRERVGLHQLHPLLVHAVTHGPGYAAHALATARRYA